MMMTRNNPDPQRAAMEAADRAYQLALARARQEYGQATRPARETYLRAVDQAQINWIAACDEARRAGPPVPPPARAPAAGIAAYAAMSDGPRTCRHCERGIWRQEGSMAWQPAGPLPSLCPAGPGGRHEP